LVWILAGTAAAADRSILVAVAHPGDESTMGALLAHYARRGVRVQVAAITLGQRGVSPQSRTLPAEQLGKIRIQELKCACQAYGAAEPILFGEEDGKLAEPQRQRPVAGQIRDTIAKLRPTVVLTLGPDGFTGNPDHLTVSSLVTQVFQSWPEGAYAPERLYYLAYPASKFSQPVPPFRRPLNTVNDRFITTTVNVTSGLPAGVAAIDCYKSQWNPEQMQALKDIMSERLGGNVYLRLALSRTKSSGKDLF
jgi:LmbE family N-acetylglucosaminyl deacetylase